MALTDAHDRLMTLMDDVTAEQDERAKVLGVGAKWFPIGNAKLLINRTSMVGFFCRYTSCYFSWELCSNLEVGEGHHLVGYDHGSNTYELEDNPCNAITNHLEPHSIRWEYFLGK